MNTEQINCAMAELDGYTRDPSNPNRPLHKSWPDYTSSLNAIARIEAKLAGQQFHIWVSYMHELAGNGAEALRLGPLQRCQAILRAVGKWKDTP